MACKNRGMYGFLGPSWVLITMAMAPVISPPPLNVVEKIGSENCRGGCGVLSEVL